MTTRAAIVMLFLALPGFVRAQEPTVNESPPPVDGPRLEIERTIRFAEIIQGTVLELRVPVKNGGTTPLTIHRIETSCGCTAVQVPGAPIPPGEKGELVLRYDSTGKQGTQSVQLHIYSDDPTAQDMGRFCTQIFLQGDVRCLYRIQPAGVFFGEVVAGSVEPRERVVTVAGQGEARGGFTARVASGLPSYLQVDLEPLPPIREGGKPGGARVKVRLLSDAPRGELSQVVVLETDMKEQAQVRIPVMGHVVGRVSAPEAIQFLPVPRGTRVPRQATVERRDDAGALAILRVESPAPWLEIETQRLTPRRSVILVTLAEFAPQGPFAFVVRAVLSEPPGEVAEIPVYGLVLPRVRCEPAIVLVRDSALKTGEQRLTLVGGSARGVRVEPDDADLTARLDPAAANSIIVSPAAGSVPATSIVVTTDVPGEESLTVPIERLPQ